MFQIYSLVFWLTKISNSLVKGINNGSGLTWEDIENIDSWTDAFLNYAKILVEKHTTMASELFTFMSIIRGALADATFDRVYMYDRQFRLRCNSS
jgi:predicted secreted protein